MHMQPVNNIQSNISAPPTQKKQKNKKKKLDRIVWTKNKNFIQQLLFSLNLLFL